MLRAEIHLSLASITYIILVREVQMDPTVTKLTSYTSMLLGPIPYCILEWSFR